MIITKLSNVAYNTCLVSVLGEAYFVRRLSWRGKGTSKSSKPVKPPKEKSKPIDPCPPFIEDSHLDPSIPEPKVLIIGAGVAGLACANRLAQCGMKNYMVLEATSKPGGRIQSCWLNKSSVCEFGPQFMQGAGPENPLYGLAAVAGLIREPLLTRVPPDPLNVLYLRSDGQPVDSMTATIGYQIFQQIKAQAKQLYFMSTGKGHGTLYHFLDKKIGEEVKAVPQHSRKVLRAVMYGMVNSIAARWGADTNQISATEYGAYESVNGPSVMVPVGLVGALSPLVDRLSAGNVTYNKPVRNIAWNENKAEVICCDGDRLMADHVVVTVSLGVLKAELPTFFTPELPKLKVKAIEGLGYGKKNKIFLEYQNPFWLKGRGHLFFAWTDEEISTKDSWVKSVSQLEEVPGRDDMLTCTVGGQAAAEIEGLSDLKVAEDMTAMMRKFAGTNSIPYPTSVIKTKWCNDLFFHGTNSYMKLGSNSNMIRDLAKPLGNDKVKHPLVLFAGEATVDSFFSTAHGAYFSGVREAERILNTARTLSLPKKE